jgi:site-specific recombinase XerD
MGINPIKADSIRKLIPTRTPGLPKKLTKVELWKLLNIQVNTAGLTKPMFEAAMVFYFQFASNGMRIGDAMNLKWRNITSTGIELLNEKGETYQAIPFNNKNISCLRWFIDYDNNYKVWDWDQREFSWDKDTYVDYRMQSKLLSLDGDYFEALQEISNYRETIIFETPGYHLSEKSEYDLEMEISKQIPLGLYQRLKKIEKSRNSEILNIILKDLNTTSRANQYVFPYMRKYAHTTNQKMIRQRLDSCATIINKQLKRIARLLCITEFSTHWNRHSLAQKLADGNVDIHVIKEMFNHSTYKVTENYMKSFKANTDGVYNKVFKDLNM